MRTVLVIYRSEPRNVCFSHLYEIQRVGRGANEVRGCLHDGCSIGSLHGLLLRTIYRQMMWRKISIL